MTGIGDGKPGDDRLGDEKLGALFRAAASESGPPPGFDHSSVVGASRRVTARRRAAVTGSAVALLAVVGVGAVVTLPGSSDTSTTAAPEVAPDRADAPFLQEAPPPAPDRPQPAQPAPRDDAPELRRAPAPPAQPPEPGPAEQPDAARAMPRLGGPAPLGPGNVECADRQDPALRALVDQALPEVAGAPDAATTMECRPGGERGVSVEAGDDGVAGLLSVRYLPPGMTGRGDPNAVSEATASGGTVIVSSRPSEVGTTAPFADRLAAVANFLAPRL